MSSRAPDVEPNDWGPRMFDPSTLLLWLTKKEPQLLTAARYFEKKAD
jgi:hypothetical protein